MNKPASISVVNSAVVFPKYYKQKKQTEIPNDMMTNMSKTAILLLKIRLVAEYVNIPKVCSVSATVERSGVCVCVLVSLPGSHNLN